MVSTAHLIGVPFAHRGRDKDTGLDCLGLLIEIYKLYGFSLEGMPDLDYSQDWALEQNLLIENAHSCWTRTLNPSQVGDVALFATKSSGVKNHIAVCIKYERWMTVSRLGGAHGVSRDYIMKLDAEFYTYDHD